MATGVRLTRVSDGAAVPGVGATSGGGDTVSFRPDETLLPSTLYRFDVLDTTTDTSGNKFFPFSSVFTTRADSTNPGTDLRRLRQDRRRRRQGQGVHLAGLRTGRQALRRHHLRPDLPLRRRRRRHPEQPVRDQHGAQHASAAGWEGAPNRTVIGMAFDPASTPTNPILWITDNYAYLGSDVPDEHRRDLPAERREPPELPGGDHQPAAVDQGPRDQLRWPSTTASCYITQGSMNAMGGTDGTWKRAEHLMSAAVLELDPAKLPANLPVDVSTPDMVKQSTSNRATASTYNPYAANAPLTFYATGVRNAFDLVWHSNGNLYVGTNGSAAGGSTPAVPATLPAACANRPDGGYTGPTAPALTNNRQDETDYFFNVKKGKYYGHPNPLRCEYILNAGNPTELHGQPAVQGQRLPGRAAGRPQLRPRQRQRRGHARLGQRQPRVPERRRLRRRAEGQAGPGPLQRQPGAGDLRRPCQRQPLQRDDRHHRLHRLRPAARRRRGPHHRQPVRQ